jgi:hypothetical protein
MKSFFLMAAFAASVSIYSAKAFASASCMNSCAVSVASDVGTSKRCGGTIGSGCDCSEYADCYSWYLNSTWCASGDTLIGTTITNKKCCIRTSQNCPFKPIDETEAQQEVRSSANANQFNSIFTVEPEMVEVHWGYVSTSNRSPSVGRATSIKARLDICLGSSDVDAAIATMNANTCKNSYCDVTNVNEYCNQYGYNGGNYEQAAVCHDRCECAINGTSDASCNQL